MSVAKRNKLIRVTIIKNGAKDRVFHPNNSSELICAADGYCADQVRLELDFDKTDIENMIKFLQITKHCFPQKNQQP